jgi:hydroxylamine reductase
VLLTLLALGVKGIRIGPNPPAFVSPGVLAVPREKFDLRLITQKSDPIEDLRAIVG